MLTPRRRQHVTVHNYLIARSTEVRRPKEYSMESSYRVAGIDVHKSMLAVVVSDVAGEGEFQFERRRFGAARKLCTIFNFSLSASLKQ